ncbi:MAG: NfeD family protein [Methylophilaceae bacterium]
MLIHFDGELYVDALWVWGILGLILLAFEMATGTFYIFWFGIAALILAGALSIFPSINVALQLLLYSVLSLGSLAIWRRFYKKTGTDLKIGQSEGDEIGRVGIIIEAVSARKNGRIQFAQGVMGSREWAAIANEDIDVGADAVITGIEGNSLRVKKQ